MAAPVNQDVSPALDVLPKLPFVDVRTDVVIVVGQLHLEILVKICQCFVISTITGCTFATTDSISRKTASTA